MTTLTNLYAEKINSEHPIASWMLNESLEYISKNESMKCELILTKLYRDVYKDDILLDYIFVAGKS